MRIKKKGAHVQADARPVTERMPRIVPALLAQVASTDQRADALIVENKRPIVFAMTKTNAI